MNETIFWVMVMSVAYVYAGYPLLLAGGRALRRRRPGARTTTLPSVSLVIAAYNEEAVIADKIRNALALHYPADRLQIIVASDGSTDNTGAIVRSFGRQIVKLVALPQNCGKSSAQNLGAAAAEGDILLFTDADVLLDPSALKVMLQHFADPTVGCVVAQIAYTDTRTNAVSAGEGLYWRYELCLREQESRLGNFAMGSGTFAIRRKLFKTLPANVGEDFVLPMQTAQAGYRVVYEPNAVARTPLGQTTVPTMFRSKVRVISKDLRGLFMCRALLNPLCYPLYAWGLVSHKLLRWLVPYFMLTALAVNLLLLEIPFYRLTLLLQVLFYGLAGLGFFVQTSDRLPRWMGIPFSFCLVNGAALVGVARYVCGRTSGQWTPVRQPSTEAVT